VIEEATVAQATGNATGSNVGPADRGHPRRWWIMAVLGAVAFMAQLDFFIVNVALDGIGRSFPGSNEAELSWVLGAYAIIFAAVLVPAGRFADLYGRKKVLLAGIAVFTAASALASFAPTLGVLILARAIQAVGGAMIVLLDRCLDGDVTVSVGRGAAARLPRHRPPSPALARWLDSGSRSR
jgi:MFS family permease